MKSSVKLLPKQKRQVAQLGERLKLARLRRGLSAQLVAERAGISRQSLTRIEAGEPNVTISNLFQVMRVLDRCQPAIFGVLDWRMNGFHFHL